MQSFVSGTALTTSIHRILRARKPARFAVAFWGKNAAKLLKLPRDLRHLTIICDLKSGACNPDELDSFLDRGARIWTKDGLHAKVYLSDGSAVIASANASANGLGEEGASLNWALEAGIATDDKEVVSAAEAWFKAHLEDSERVDAKLIEKFRAVWNRRVNQAPARGKTLLEVFDSNPARLKSRAISILAYTHEEPAPSEIEAFKSEGPRVFGARFEKYDEDSEYPFYVDGDMTMDVSPGDWFLDFHVSGAKKPKVTFNGIWQVLLNEQTWQMKLESGGRLVFLDKMPNVSGMSFPRKEQARMKNAIEQYLSKRKRVPAAAGNFIDIPVSEFAKLEA